MHYNGVMNRTALVAIATVALCAFAGCAADTESTEGDVEQGEDNLTQGQRDERNMKRIRDAVKDVEQEHVTFPVRSTKSPSANPSSGFSGEHASLYGVDWFQQWPDGVSADHGWENGTDLGKRCMWAAVLRFEAIMKDAPPELVAFLGEYDQWSGNFYNWVDDFSGKSASGEAAGGDASGARLWAWRTGLSKWISQTAKDGSCYLPTRKMVVDYAAACKEHVASREDKQMQGCQVR